MQNSKPVEQLTYSVAQSARALGVSEETIKRLLKSEQLKSIHVGTRVLVPVTELRSFAQRGTDAPAEHYQI